MDFDDVLKKRKSKRWYLDKDLPNEIIGTILEQASLAPSFMNNQPWEVAVVKGKKLQEIAELMEARQKQNKITHSISWTISWSQRQQKILEKMKKAKGKREMPDEPRAKWMYNAPVVLFIHIHRYLNEWAIFDLGLFVENILLSATNLGIATVPQARMGDNNEDVGKLLGLEKDRRIIMGVTMGYADSTHVNNQFLSDREPLKEWTTWHE